MTNAICPDRRSRRAGACRLRRGGGPATRPTPRPERPPHRSPRPRAATGPTTVTKTADGGYLVGNPNAPVKLVEYLLAHLQPLRRVRRDGLRAADRENYVTKGTVSFEVRNYVRDPIDVAAALLSRCNGAEPYLALTEQMLGAQNEFIPRRRRAFRRPMLQRIEQHAAGRAVQGARRVRSASISSSRQRGVSRRSGQCLPGRQGRARRTGQHAEGGQRPVSRFRARLRS